MISGTIKEMLSSILSAHGLADHATIELVHPADPAHGDYTTNIALVFAKDAGKTPNEFAELICTDIKKNIPTEIDRVEVAGNGFINFFLSADVFKQTLTDILNQGEDFGKNNSLEGQRVIVEYTDPNPFKEMHIGHVMSNSIGEAIARLYAWSGAELRRACYQGDVGLHVAKAIWGMRELTHAGKRIDSPELLGASYALGAEAYNGGGPTKDQIEALNEKIYAQSDPEVNELYEIGKNISLAHFEKLYDILGTTFDEYFFESESGPAGKRLVDEHTGTIFKQSEGAVVFPAEDYNPKLHTRVFINKLGIPTYEAKELGLAVQKYERFLYDLSVVVTGNEVNSYFAVLLTALTQIQPELAKKTKHIGHGMLRLPSGKMSSRTGDVITAEALLRDVQKGVLEKMKDNAMAEDERRSVAQDVAVGAIKYSILRQSIGKDTIFDFERSLSFEGDSGPYLQYTYARALSTLRKAESEGLVAGNKEESTVGDLERTLYHFPSVIRRASQEHAPHHVVTYLTELASLFNRFYAAEKIVDKTDAHAPYRILLTHAVSQVLANGLSVLGIRTPKAM